MLNNMGGTMAAVGRDKLDNVQVLRGVAALLVVVSHLTKELVNSNGFELYDTLNLTLVGQAGVDLFFIISGFIMVYTTWGEKAGGGSASLFFRKRLARIVPLYWVLSVVMILITVFFAGMKNNNYMDAEYIIKSFLFIPAERVSDGKVTPVFGLGWTLNYEMFFYSVFALSMYYAAKVRLLFSIVAMIGIVIVGAFFERDSNVAIWYWSRPIILEFVLGMLMGWFYIKSDFRISKYLATLLALIASVLFLALTSGVVGLADLPTAPEYRMWVWGLPLGLLFYSFVFVAEKDDLFKKNNLFVRFFLFVGNSSFSLYLFHMFVIRAGSVLVIKMGFEFNNEETLFYGVLTTLMCVYLSHICYKKIEVPGYGIAKKVMKV